MLVPAEIHPDGTAAHRLFINRTRILAQPAVYAKPVVNFRIKEAIITFAHYYCAMGTRIDARSASRALCRRTYFVHKKKMKKELVLVRAEAHDNLFG